jgi:4-hydroxy-tetrahydrodipicolinate reductase
MKIALIGYGKMGHMIEELATAKGHEVVLRIHIDNTEEFTKENMAKADVAIEFTAPESAYENVLKCLSFGIPVISGSTGWNDNIPDAVKRCKELNGTFLHASNFSIGVNIFFEINRLLARLMSAQPDYETELKEIHHTQKKDSPSGTAVTLAEQILSELVRKRRWVNAPTHNKEELSIISERVDPAPGTHVVRYSSEEDAIEIIHTAHNRKGFALGAIQAAEYIHDKQGVFSMKDVLNIGS